MAIPNGSAAAAPADSDRRMLAIIGYGLFLVGWPCLHLPTIAGVVLAHVKRNETRGTIWESHFDNLITTFWVSLVAMIVAVPLCFVLIGIPLVALIILWFLYRTIKGLIRAIEGRAYS